MTNWNVKLMAVAIAGAATMSMIPASAGPILFTPSGDSNSGNLKCEVALNSLGNIQLRGGTANISGRVVTIKSGSEYIEAPRTVLAGSVLRTEANLSSEPPNITGLALFLMGDWKYQLDDGTTNDVIFRRDGHIEGRILGIEDETLSVNIKGVPQRIPLSSVLYIRSPRVFVFKIALKTHQPLKKDTVLQAEAGDSSFRPTASARTMTGSVIPMSDRKDDGLGGPMSIRDTANANGTGGMGGMGGTSGAPGLGGSNVMGGMGGLPAMNTFNRPTSSGPSQYDNSFDDGDDSNRFSTVHTKYGDQKLTLPPGILD